MHTRNVRANEQQTTNKHTVYIYFFALIFHARFSSVVFLYWLVVKKKSCWESMCVFVCYFFEVKQPNSSNNVLETILFSFSSIKSNNLFTNCWMRMKERWWVYKFVVILIEKPPSKNGTLFTINIEFELFIWCCQVISI